MDGRKPGPICSSSLGSNWIDESTMCRSRSSKPGPVGFVISLVMGAVPEYKDIEEKRRQKEERLMIAYDIDLIESSPLGQTKEGKEIIELLRSKNKMGKIIYADTGDARGDWDGEIIRVSDNFRAKICPTSLELVHEATHALWRKKHPFSNKNAEDRRKENITDELHAQENQLILYRYLRKNNNCPEDSEMERRLKRQADKKLKEDVENHFE